MAKQYKEVLRYCYVTYMQPISQTEGAPLPLLHLHIFSTSEIVDRLLQLKQKNLKGPTKRLTHKTLKT